MQCITIVFKSFRINLNILNYRYFLLFNDGTFGNIFLSYYKKCLTCSFKYFPFFLWTKLVISHLVKRHLLNGLVDLVRITRLYFIKRSFCSNSCCFFCSWISSLMSCLVSYAVHCEKFNKIIRIKKKNHCLVIITN